MPHPPSVGTSEIAGAKHSQFLDLVRAAAIWLVLLRHGYLYQPGTPENADSWTYPFRNLALNGWLGVDVFFVLSGFLLSRQLLGSGIRNKDYRGFSGEFWQRRAYRILPCYLLVVVSIWLLLEYGPDSMGATGSLELMTHLFFMQDYFGSEILVPTWSLATEVKFYLLLPFLVLASLHISPNRFSAILLIASIAVLAGRLHSSFDLGHASYPEFFWRVRAPFHHAIDGLLLGVAAGYVHHAYRSPFRHAGRNKLAWILASASILLALLLVCTNWLEASFMASSAMIWIVSMLTACIVLSGAYLEEIGKPPMRVGKTTMWTAAISYPLYLIHYVLIGPCSTLALLAVNSTFWAQVIFWLSYIGCSFLAAWLIHRLVELPFLNLRKSRKTRVLATGKTGA